MSIAAPERVLAQYQRGMLACDYLARVGFLALRGPAVDFELDDAIETEHQRVRAALLDGPIAASMYSDNVVRIGRTMVTWPDRVPGLITWAGQQSLAKIAAKLRKDIARSDEPDLFALRVASLGMSGIDASVCPDAIDVGFSLPAAKMQIAYRPAVELLAIIGLESVPLVSFRRRECGFVHDRTVWRFSVEAREQGYYRRWGELHRDH